MKLSTKIQAFSGLVSNLFHKPVTVRESFGFIAYLSRGLPRRDVIRCTGCGACNERCSSGATSITDHEGMRTVSIDSLRCIFCARCADICPEGALDLYFGTVHHDKDMSGAAGTIEHAATSDMSRQCLHDHDLDLSASVQYAKAISLSHKLEDKSVTVDTLLPLQKCRFCGEEMPVTEKFLQVMAERMLTHLKPETAEVVRKDLELYLTACISCRQKLSVKWNTHPRKFI
ncbi:NADH-quinone oxidoreductase subunit I [Methanospirillum lacunae]|uniref:Hydrogenase n=1 Tax=Methanospirillum lacunae TaxID=668570 RepID=A0A2V2NAH2_9EURY|nr:4Fe-4S dicluster domain-containing protein [Methanospirillum lacunae]PWR72273.1 hydrogenase [Methanospirillum lacunae]